MPSSLTITLNANPAQAERLEALQELFAAACNDLAPLVKETRCWNRVALHHLAYKGLRERFPTLGSQMACNAIYSVSRSARIVYQHPDSPWNITAKPAAGLPLLHFLPQAPVYFDRHTLSLKDNQLSLFTLDGRMRFVLQLAPRDQERFANQKLREIAMFSGKGRFLLTFQFAEEGDVSEVSEPDRMELPNYLVIQSEAQQAGLANAPSPGRSVTA